MPRLQSKLALYQDILRFVLALFGANILWKLAINGDETTEVVTCFGQDVSAFFNYIVAHIANVVACLVKAFRPTLALSDFNVLRFDNGHTIHIVWSCTAIKQSFIWLVIMCVARGAWKHKAWFIPLGVVCIYVFNIFRIVFITISMENHPEYFEVLHAYILKYLFYGMLFLLWLWWDKRWKAPTKDN